MLSSTALKRSKEFKAFLRWGAPQTETPEIRGHVARRAARAVWRLHPVAAAIAGVRATWQPPTPLESPSQYPPGDWSCALSHQFGTEVFAVPPGRRRAAAARAPSCRADLDEGDGRRILPHRDVVV